MKSALTLTKVRTMVRLYRAEIEGAEENLEAVMREHLDELPALLGIALNQALRIAQHDDPVPALARVAEASAARSTGRNTSARRDAAQVAAADLGKAAVFRDGRHHLPIALLRKVLELWRGRGDIAFEDCAAVDIARLRALVRRCAHLDSTVVTLSKEQLLFNYSTTRARGAIRLFLHAPADPKQTLRVPISPASSATASPPSAHGAIYVPAPWPADDAQRADSPQPVLPPTRPVLFLVRQR